MSAPTPPIRNNFFYIRTVDDNLEAKKDFLGFYKERSSCACNGRYFVEV